MKITFHGTFEECGLLYRERRNALVETLRSALGSVVEVTGEQAGMHLCVLLNGICDREIAQRAVLADLWLVPLSPSYVGSKGSRQGFILGFGSRSAEAMPGAVKKLRLGTGFGIKPGGQLRP